MCRYIECDNLSLSIRLSLSKTYSLNAFLRLILNLKMSQYLIGFHFRVIYLISC
jgi:hypothetical protein